MTLSKYKKIGLYVCFFVVFFCTIVFGGVVFMGKKVYNPVFGMSFDPEYAESMGLEWKTVYMRMLEDFGPEYIRISAKWSRVQSEGRDVFDYDDIDWMMHRAYEKNTKVVLAFGQKSPRWPECYIPSWVSKDMNVYEYDLLRYVERTVTRYQNHPALFMWQVENEPFIMFNFGECDGFDKSLVEKEVARVRMYDVRNPVLLTDSGELGLWKKASRLGDVFGTTLYRIVRKPNGKIFTYDWLGPGWYNLKAWLLGIRGENMIVSELQAEPWFFEDTPTTASLLRMEETMSPERFLRHIEFVRRLSVEQVYLWGVEWWYFMMYQHNDQRYWDIARELFTQVE